MKYGWQLVYHSSIDEKYMSEVENFLNLMYKWFSSPNSYKVGHRNYLSRDASGLPMQVASDSDLIFRRLSRSKRIFGVIPKDMIERLDGVKSESYQLNQFPYGGPRVRMKEPFKQEDYVVVYEVGEIKG